MSGGIRTVTGLLEAGSVGVADAHCHLWIFPSVPGAPTLADRELAVAELSAFAEEGGSLVVDCQPGGCGRNAGILHGLARQTGVAVVAASGFHLRRYYPEDPEGGPWSEPPEEAAARFEREVVDGTPEEPSVKAGVLKSAWTGGGGAESGLMEAVLDVARRTSTPVVVHTEAGAGVETLTEICADSGLYPSLIQISHLDKRPDPVLHRELAEAGFVLGYDTFHRPKYDPDSGVWELLRMALSQGFWSQITLGLDIADSSSWAAEGGPGLRSLATEIVPRLRAEGAGTREIAGLSGGNVAGLLAGSGKAA